MFRRKVDIFILLFSLIFLFVSPMNAAAGKRDRRPLPPNDRFVLEFGNRFFPGNHTTITKLHLKKALKEQYPWLNVSDYRLRNLVLVAKTKRGGGHAKLRVGPKETDFYLVAGHPRSFHNDRRSSFDKIRIRSPFYDSWGPWQLFLRGNFKIKKIILVVERRYRSHYGWSRYERHAPHNYGWDYPDSGYYFNRR